MPETFGDFDRWNGLTQTRPLQRSPTNHAFQLNQVVDEYEGQHRRLEAAINALLPQVALTEPVWYERTHELAHAQANALAELVGGVG